MRIRSGNIALVVNLLEVLPADAVDAIHRRKNPCRITDLEVPPPLEPGGGLGAHELEHLVEAYIVCCSGAGDTEILVRDLVRRFDDETHHCILFSDDGLSSRYTQKIIVEIVEMRIVLDRLAVAPTTEFLEPLVPQR